MVDAKDLYHARIKQFDRDAGELTIRRTAYRLRNVARSAR